MPSPGRVVGRRQMAPRVIGRHVGRVIRGQVGGRVMAGWRVRRMIGPHVKAVLTSFLKHNQPSSFKHVTFHPTMRRPHNCEKIDVIDLSRMIKALCSFATELGCALLPSGKTYLYEQTAVFFL